MYYDSWKFSRLAQIFRQPGALEDGDLLAPRRQERQVRNRFFLCGLCVFARDIPSFGCGSAAL